VHRRTFLARTGAALGAAALGPAAAGAGQGATSTSRTSRQWTARTSGRIIVIGAGAFGGWTALHLAESGMEVVLVDAYGAGSARATSGGDSRGLRFAYGDRRMYTEMAIQAKTRWNDRQTQWETGLMLTTGRISLYPESTPALETIQDVLVEAGAEFELLTPEEIQRRWPQMTVEGVEVGLFEPGATAIRANTACRLIARKVEEAGGTLKIGQVEPPRGEGILPGVQLRGGGELHGDAFVFACGSWLPALFPELLGDRISVPRRDVFFFGPPAGDPRFSFPHLPNFSEGSQSVYGFPDLDGFGFKVAPFGGLDPFDPDRDERVPAAHWLQRARRYLALRFPGIVDQPLVHSRVCQLENTDDDHFIIDRHPAWENVWIAGGGSGHAFKHGPILGEIVATRVQGQDMVPEWSPHWAL
jgi:sarcosine oxidase